MKSMVLPCGCSIFSWPMFGTDDSILNMQLCHYHITNELIQNYIQTVFNIVKVTQENIPEQYINEDI